MGLNGSCPHNPCDLRLIPNLAKNTITGLQGIDPSLEEAAVAFGMTKWGTIEEV